MRYFVVLLLFSSACSTIQRASEAPPLALQQVEEERNFYEATGRTFVVATQGVAATEAAKKAFRQGGNIIDAAVAASFAISVERPQSTGLGGGGFLLYRVAKTGEIYAIDFRERAPLKATEKMYLDAKGEVIPNRSLDGILAVGVPGLVAGLLEVHERWGRLPRAKVIEHAKNLAESGMTVYPYLAKALADRKEVLARYSATAKIFLKENGEPLQIGDNLVQKDLAKTLDLIAQKGSKAFYDGPIAEAIVVTSRAQGGLLTRQDLRTYEVKWRRPVRGHYKGYEVVSMPPPSSGGTHVIEILNILEGDSLRKLGFDSADAIHLKAAAMQQSFADRATYMGDPDFNPHIPLDGLLSKTYARKIREGIDLARAKSADEVKAGNAYDYESSDTTHFSIMDSDGNVVVSTQTINGWMGSGVVVPGTGILLNNEMDDFSAKPGAANLFGAIGGAPNAIAPRKTPLSSMAPTIVLKDEKPVLALGAPGGTRIITCVAQTVINFLDFGFPLYDSVSAVRMHHQWQPDILTIEAPGLSPQTTQELERKGYKLRIGDVPCRVNAVAREGSTLKGVADPRDLGSAWGD